MILIDENITIKSTDAAEGVAEIARYLNGVVEKLNAALMEIEERLQEMEG